MVETTSRTCAGSSRGSQVKIPEDALTRYDENIRAHPEAINCNRPNPITLRYFQHLAALYTEIFLDRLFNTRAQLGFPMAEEKLRLEVLEKLQAEAK